MKIMKVIALSLAISTTVYANVSECIEAGKNHNYDATIEYCKEFADNNQEALGFLIGAYAIKYDGLNAQTNLQKYIDKYGNNLDSKYKQVTIGYYASLGNYYYFGEDGAKKDIKKGVEYITKGAKLGNDIAQEQLATIYFNGDNAPVNYPKAYMWYTISANNGNQKAKNNYFAEHKSLYLKEAPICIAMGKQLVAESYLNGEAGLPKSDAEAKRYLDEAIKLYKKEDKPSDDELKYCPPQKGLSLDSAENLLKLVS